MSLPALATIEDVEARLGQPVTDTDRVEALLDDASAIVRAYAKETWVNEDGDLEDVPPGVPGVVASMVVRVLQNPRGVTQEGAGPFNVSYGSGAGERLYLTVGEKAILGSPQRAFTVDPTPQPKPLDPLEGAQVN